MRSPWLSESESGKRKKILKSRTFFNYNPVDRSESWKNQNHKQKENDMQHNEIQRVP